MDVIDEKDESELPLTEWVIKNRTLPSISINRKRITAAKHVKVDSADAKFTALVASTTNKEKERRNSSKKPKSSTNIDLKHFTSRCFELGQNIAMVELKSYKQSVSGKKVRTTVEFGFGADMLIYMVFESDGRRNLSGADLVEYFVNDEASIAEIASALKKLFEEQMYQSLLMGVVTYSRLKDQRRELLERLRVKYSPLLSVETTGEGFCTVEARDIHHVYFQAQWKVVYRRGLDVFDNAFMFTSNLDDKLMMDCFKEFFHLTDAEEMGVEELERSWEKIMTLVKGFSERHT